MEQALTEGGHPEDFWNIVNLLNPPNSILKLATPALCKGKKAAIIGAGLAGLSAAFELRKLGFDITVFEKQKERIGGRVYTYYFDKGKSLYGELGGAVVPVAHQTVWHYVDLFHLKTRPCASAVSGYIYDRGIRIRNDPLGLGVKAYLYPQYRLTKCEKGLPWEQWMQVYVHHDLLRLLPEERREILQIKQQYCDRYWQYDHLSLRQILEKNRLSNGGMELLSTLALHNAAWNNCSCNWSRSYLETDSCLYQIEGGASSLPEAFQRSLAMPNPPEYQPFERKRLGNVCFRQGAAVVRIEGGFPDRVRLFFREQGQSAEELQDFDYVISTVPFPALRTLQISPAFSPEKMQVIREVQSMPAQKTLFLCKTPFWCEDGIHGGRSVTDLPVQTVWYPNGPVPSGDVPTDIRVLTASVSFGQDAVVLGAVPAAQRAAWTKRQIERIHGLAEHELDPVVLRCKTLCWADEAGFYGAFPRFAPGQRTAFALAAAQPEYDGRVLFAGDAVSTQPGWMQGALQSGMLAANEVACQAVLHPFPD
ncbi:MULTISPECIES: flavin monoamine oxidase family protein [Caproicibacterium]|uniref:FAD-dependent oxidoreductase n=1 Tax=Caproicibacterium argilliputei TaxID=3030016 RepID=A0AA97D8U1_9FIRM|nr:NAD(P)/FAD-dependent oxidoreductase [Caproicibacterium argilliputei]WOC31163.1 FAD-dependent oxidoreductase [Caproicibacterium argilliputei]